MSLTYKATHLAMNYGFGAGEISRVTDRRVIAVLEDFAAMTYPEMVEQLQQQNMAAQDISWSMTPQMIVEAAKPAPEPERVEKRMDQMTIEDWRRGVAKSWRSLPV